MASPSHLYPLVRAFLATNGFAATVVAFDKELGKNKVASQVDADLFEICKEYLTKNLPVVTANGSSKRKLEDESSNGVKKAKVEKEEKKAKKEESSDESSGSDSDSDSSSKSSDSDSSDSGSSDSESDSGSGSDSDSSSDESGSDSSSGSDSDSDSSEDEKDKKKDKKEKKDKKDKKEKKGNKDKKDKKEKKEENGKVATPSTPSTPATNGTHTPSNGTPVATTPTSGKKTTPFRRVTEEDAALLQNKFADNTFESKKGDEFGRKANEILSQVRGKGFRTEKTKKKKGTYRGGTIDLGINSVKYVYDD